MIVSYDTIVYLSFVPSYKINSLSVYIIHNDFYKLIFFLDGEEVRGRYPET